MNIAALCDADTAVGLRLAGVHQIFVPTSEQTPTQLWHTILDHLDDIALLIITEAIAASIGHEFEEFRLRTIIPVIIEIPDKQGKIPDHIDFVSNLIKKAVGMEINK